ncbi:unnamed protein product [Hermetia illucens]|uniref:Phospholipid/glycerol acyltransferase domain-containing protein n=2 Tax=Hermetia illucens TaxID=343691 RepID=A0A7R8UX00_HERIL|nr:unnamed protein product [Hermetia illucens]
MLAGINKSVGVRRAYVKLLLKIFEYGRQNIESAKKRTRPQQDDSDEDDDSSNSQDGQSQSESGETESQKKKLIPNGNGYLPEHHHSNGNTLISRDTLILLPNGDTKNKSAAKENNENKKENSDDETKKDEEISFNLAKCLDYIKTGVEAIIEDEVTSRFEAEELKNWNLLTRTNQNYEFISWRLSVIWICGFVIRYLILMPIRVFICFVGVYTSVVSNALVALIPFRRIRRPLAELAYMMTFRFLTRSLSAVITVHNPENKPKNCGFCVANHTTPIDIAILSTDCTFSLVIWLTICTALVGSMPDGEKKRQWVKAVSGHCFSVLSSAISAVITYHNMENRPKKGICVANHTSPIDVLVLMCDNTYSLIGQRHGGFLGILQRALGRASPHIWFERAEAKDRHAVAQRLRQHVSDPNNPPILIFPEGTCINNTSVMQFKKGSFEVGGVIYPVAIKYDPRFGDAFWNSSKYSMMQYLYMMMTSWAIVCDVWYLPPMYRGEDESAIDFANRVKAVIAKQGGLVDLDWDGQLKRMKPKKEWKEKQQIEFTKRLKGE